MYDAITTRLIEGAPPLEGLDPDTLKEELTAAYVEIASARLALAETPDEAIAIDGPPQADHFRPMVERMTRLANSYESRIVLGLDDDRRRATAFVAGSARQVVATATRIGAEARETSLLSEDAVDGDLAAALLFLIAERSSDASEAAKSVWATGEPVAIRRALILAIGRLARGGLSEIANMNPDQEALSEDLTGHAVDLMFRELLGGLVEFARFGIGQAGRDALDSAIGRFDHVRRLAGGHTTEFDELGFEAISGFPGPFHLASLLSRAAGVLGAGALISIPTPRGSEVQAWTDWIKTETLKFPYVWENHRRAIDTGYLNAGDSLVMTSPTGSGKTTLAALKIAATITAGKTVVYLAPTHALASQVERDLNDRIAGLAVAQSVDEASIEDILPVLPALAVVTPERCFALLTFAPELFANVGLLVFDEFHLMGVSGAGEDWQQKVDRRGIDAMLCLLTFMSTAPAADLLLLSAMVSNGEELALWLHGLTGRPVHSFNDPWKPTRQLRACVTYDVQDVATAERASNTRGQAAQVSAVPYGLFSLVSGWNPEAADKLLFRPFSDAPVPLGHSDAVLGRRRITAARFEVAAAIADRYERAGLKVIIFCDSIVTCSSTADKLNRGRVPESTRDSGQDALRDAAIAELGHPDGLYDAGAHRAAVHHGDLLPEERRLVESLFRSRDSGVNILAATSTLAQGLNLPCEVVILAGTDRKDEYSQGRTSLYPHEILNALGRAGRAGQAATGLAIVIPGNVIRVNTRTKEVAANPDLEVIFSESDQCLPLSDPLTTMFDIIEVRGVHSADAEYLLRKLSATLGDNADAQAFDALVRRTFGFYRRAAAGQIEAEAWVTARRATLAAAIRANAEPPALPWEEELAAKTGASRRLIAQLAEAYPTAPHQETNALPWITWLLERLDPESADVDAFLRPETMHRVFGRAYSNHADLGIRRRNGLAGLATVLPLWFGGFPLLEIEAAIAAFIRANEGDVGRPTPAHAKAKHARKLALRLAADLGFLCGVFSQVATRVLADKGMEAPPTIQALAQLVRRGLPSQYHFALSREAGVQSRVEVVQEFAKLRNIDVSAQDDWNVVREKVSTARILLMFMDGDVEAVEQPTK